MVFPHFALVKASFYCAPYYHIPNGKIIKIDEIDEQQETNYQIFRNGAKTTCSNVAYLKFSVLGEGVSRVAKFAFDTDETFFDDVYPGFFQELTNQYEIKNKRRNI